MPTPLRDTPGFNDGSRDALAGFHRRMIVALAREMDDAPDPWVREAIADWLDEFLRESRSWRQAFPGAGGPDSATRPEVGPERDGRLPYRPRPLP